MLYSEGYIVQTTWEILILMWNFKEKWILVQKNVITPKRDRNSKGAISSQLEEQSFVVDLEKGREVHAKFGFSKKFCFKIKWFWWGNFRLLRIKKLNKDFLFLFFHLFLPKWPRKNNKNPQFFVSRITITINKFFAWKTYDGFYVRAINLEIYN